jgi:hypothetical protein
MDRVEATKADDPTGERARSAEANGAKPADNASHDSAAPTDNGSPESRIERAEEVVDRAAAWVANLTSDWGRRALRMGARIREEAEDFWAEAQSIRRGDQP